MFLFINDYNCNDKSFLFLCSSSLVYLKLLVLWGVVIVADYFLEFRFEYLWPFWLFLRSVYDSFKYQGLVSYSIIFIFYRVKIFFLVERMEPALSLARFEIPTLFFLLACRQKQQEFLNWLVIGLLSSVQLKTKYYLSQG